MQKAKRAKAEMSKRSLVFYKMTAVRNWKLYTKKCVEYKKDPILCQFEHYDNAIICQNEPGMPLVMMESDDSCNFFDTQ